MERRGRCEALGSREFQNPKVHDRVQTLSRAAMTLSHVGESQGKAWAREVT